MTVVRRWVRALSAVPEKHAPEATGSTQAPPTRSPVDGPTRDALQQRQFDDRLRALERRMRDQPDLADVDIEIEAASLRSRHGMFGGPIPRKR